jgi:hypothetical protein
MTAIMHAVKCKELTVEVGVRTRGSAKRSESCRSATDYSQTVRLSLNGTGVQAWLREYRGDQLAARRRDEYHGDKASVKIVWDIQQTIPPRSMNAS